MSPSPTSRRRPGSTTPAASSPPTSRASARRRRGARRRGGPPERRRPRLLATLLLATLALAGCGTADDESEEPATSEERVPGSAATTEAPKNGERPDARKRAPEPPVGDGRGGVELVELASFDQPLYVTSTPDSGADLYVVEQGGRIVRLSPDGSTDTFLDVSDLIIAGGEQGLLSVAFAPDFRRSGRFYVDYTDTEGNTRVVEYRSPDGRRVRTGTRRELLRIPQPFANHNGGLVKFGPDGLLYIGTGDGGSADDPQRTAQDPESLLGKILRIDPRGSDAPYGIPSANPFSEGGGRAEVLALGLRNPWRFSFDRKNGNLAIGDVGQSSFEEVTIVSPRRARGGNFGWSAFEGRERFNADQSAPNQIGPSLTYPTADGNCSVTGGYVVRDRRLRSLYGRYLYGDFCGGELRSFVGRPGRAREDRALGVERVSSLSSFGEDRRGRIYATSLEGPVYRLEPKR